MRVLAVILPLSDGLMASFTGPGSLDTVSLNERRQLAATYLELIARSVTLSASETISGDHRG